MTFPEHADRVADYLALFDGLDDADEIGEVQAALAAMVAEYERLRTSQPAAEYIAEQAHEISSLTDEVRRLREALAVFADEPCIYKAMPPLCPESGDPSGEWCDSCFARLALAGPDTPKEAS